MFLLEKLPEDITTLAGMMFKSYDQMNNHQKGIIGEGFKKSLNAYIKEYMSIPNLNYVEDEVREIVGSYVDDGKDDGIIQAMVPGLSRNDFIRNNQHYLALAAFDDSAIEPLMDCFKNCNGYHDVDRRASYNATNQYGEDASIQFITRNFLGTKVYLRIPHGTVRLYDLKKASEEVDFKDSLSFELNEIDCVSPAGEVLKGDVSFDLNGLREYVHEMKSHLEGRNRHQKDRLERLMKYAHGSEDLEMELAKLICDFDDAKPSLSDKQLEKRYKNHLRSVRTIHGPKFEMYDDGYYFVATFDNWSSREYLLDLLSKLHCGQGKSGKCE